MPSAQDKNSKDEKHSIKPSASLNKSLDQIHLKEESKQDALGDKMPLTSKSKSTLSLSEVKVKKSKPIEHSGKKSRTKENEAAPSDDEASLVKLADGQKGQEIEVANVESKSNNQDDADELADNSAEDSQDNNVPQHVKVLNNKKQKKQKYFRKKTYTNINSSSIDDGLLESVNHQSIHYPNTQFHSMLKLTSSEDEAQKGMKFTTSKEREKRNNEQKKKAKTPDKPNEVSQH